MARFSTAIISALAIIASGAVGVDLTIKRENADEAAWQKSGEMWQMAVEVRQLSTYLARDGIFLELYIQTGQEKDWIQTADMQQKLTQSRDELERKIAAHRESSKWEGTDLMIGLSRLTAGYFQLKNRIPSLAKESHEILQHMTIYRGALENAFHELRALLEENLSHQLASNLDQIHTSQNVNMITRATGQLKTLDQAKQLIDLWDRQMLNSWLTNNDQDKHDGADRALSESLVLIEQLRVGTTTTKMLHHLTELIKMISDSQQIQQQSRQNQEQLSHIRGEMATIQDAASTYIDRLAMLLADAGVATRPEFRPESNEPHWRLPVAIIIGICLISLSAVLAAGLVGRKKPGPVSVNGPQTTGESYPRADEIMARELLIGQLRAAADTLEKLRR